MDSSLTRPGMSLMDVMSSASFQTALEERRELVRQAKPLYVAQLCSIPFYKAREHDDQFWSSYIGSGVTAARRLVARSQSCLHQLPTPLKIEGA